ncbi:dTDP-4-dehydrorhamnose reductase [Pontibacterium sp.]|uniref:dTDP-4-dehydrorhamnose reductase n=1 Tax=Pontibacterium sp. TaxID=2036026 RepID=UPI0035674E9C
MKVLVVGASGQFGGILLSKLRESGFGVVACSSSVLDITSLDSVMSFSEKCPELIINAAAYTAVDAAESEPQQAYCVNETGVSNLIQLASLLECPLINISTDYVFDGSLGRPYVETDITTPLGVYGASKRAGELLLEESKGRFLNIRTSWLFSETDHNFMSAMLRLAAKKSEFGVVFDQVGCPTFAGDLADAIVKICNAYIRGRQMEWGTFHYSGDEEVSWYGFAHEIFEKAVQMSVLESRPKLQKLSTDQYPTVARRPQYSVLNCSKIQDVYGVRLSNWKNAITEILSAKPKFNGNR